MGSFSRLRLESGLNVAMGTKPAYSQILKHWRNVITVKVTVLNQQMSFLFTVLFLNDISGQEKFIREQWQLVFL